MKKPWVGIVVGSESDLPVIEDALKVLEQFDIPHELVISSAHRAPHQTLTYAETAENRGLQVIIAGAGAAAHLPGVLAASTPLPVIGLPIESGALKGIDALYAIVQMPGGVPVATVSINGAKNAGLLAVQILSVKYTDLRDKLKQYKQDLAAEVGRKNERLQEQRAAK